MNDAIKELEAIEEMIKSGRVDSEGRPWVPWDVENKVDNALRILRAEAAIESVL